MKRNQLFSEGGLETGYVRRTPVEVLNSEVSIPFIYLLKTIQEVVSWEIHDHLKQLLLKR
jgi:hypothetical protein